MLRQTDQTHSTIKDLPAGSFISQLTDQLTDQLESQAKHSAVTQYTSGGYSLARLMLIAVMMSSSSLGLIACGEDADDTAAEAGEVTAGEVTAGEVTAGEVTAGEVTAGEVTAGEVTAGEVTAGEVTAGEVTAGEVTAGEVTAGEDMAGEPAQQQTNLRIRAINPLSSSGVAEMSATLTSAALSVDGASVGVTETTTDASGVAALGAAWGERYEVVISSEQHVPHHIMGDLADEEVEQITFVSTRQLTSQVFSLLGLTPDPERGTLVVGLDLPSLAPAVGASAEIDLAYEQAFVFGATTPVAGQTVLSGGGGFVSFANVEPGAVQISVTPPEGSRCALFPAELDEAPTAQVYAGAVSVVAFTCRAE